jgi:deoxyadenosine/deoxycytidine kinase
MKRFVVVAGNIGVGKSTLVGLLAERMGWEPFFEPQGENPYLADFYSDMRTWAFQSQVFFLTRRLRAHRKLLEHPTSAIQDRSVYEDAEIFAHNLYLQGHISERDYGTYKDLYQVLSSFLPPPDLVLYLRASVATLQDRIASRGRDYERQITPEYLTQLNTLYERWVQAFSFCPVLTLPADDLDYVANVSHLDLVIEKMQEKLAGKEEVRFDGRDISLPDRSPPSTPRPEAE